MDRPVSQLQGAAARFVGAPTDRGLTPAEADALMENLSLDPQLSQLVRTGMVVKSDLHDKSKVKNTKKIVYNMLARQGVAVKNIVSRPDADVSRYARQPESRDTWKYYTRPSFPIATS